MSFVRNLLGAVMHQRHRQVIAFIAREDDWYVATCPEFEVASQGRTVDEARDNLREAVELFLETASQEEIAERRHEEVYITHMEIACG